MQAVSAVIHIGLAKTGTSTIQHFLYDNRRLLAEQGFLYPLSVMNHNLSFHSHHMLAYNRLCRRDFEALRAELQETGLPHLIISAENLQALLTTPDQIGALRDFLERLGFAQVRIIIYLRQVQSLFISMCSQNVKNGHLPPYAHLPPQDNAEMLALADFRTTLSRWGAVFGRGQLCVRLFERSAFCQGDLLRDFCQAAGLQWDGRFACPAPQNESLNLLEMELLERINHLRKGCVDFTDNLKHYIYTRMHRHLGRLSADPQLRFRPPRELLQAYAEQFRDSCQWTQEAFFPGRGELFAPMELQDYRENCELRDMKPEYWQQLAAFIYDLAAHNEELMHRLQELEAELQSVSAAAGVRRHD